MIKRVIGTLVSLAVLATVVFTVLHRERFHSLVFSREAVDAAAGEPSTQSEGPSAASVDAPFADEQQPLSGQQSSDSVQSSTAVQPAAAADSVSEDTAAETSESDSLRIDSTAAANAAEAR